MYNTIVILYIFITEYRYCYMWYLIVGNIYEYKYILIEFYLF